MNGKRSAFKNGAFLTSGQSKQSAAEPSERLAATHRLNAVELVGGQDAAGRRRGERVTHGGHGGGGHPVTGGLGA